MDYGTEMTLLDEMIKKVELRIQLTLYKISTDEKDEFYKKLSELLKEREKLIAQRNSL